MWLSISCRWRAGAVAHRRKCTQSIWSDCWSARQTAITCLNSHSEAGFNSLLTWEMAEGGADWGWRRHRAEGRDLKVRARGLYNVDGEWVANCWSSRQAAIMCFKGNFSVCSLWRWTVLPREAKHSSAHNAQTAMTLVENKQFFPLNPTMKLGLTLYWPELAEVGARQEDDKEWRPMCAERRAVQTNKLVPACTET